ncbi:MAG: MATE family efflux transporter [Christensenellales bacterium]|jgi:putative MATE family efflux protein
MSERIKDMTQGKPARLILSFALPLMLGNICQQFYTLVDTAVVGQFVGVEALASLGAADWLNWLVLGVMTGFTQGCGILMAQRFGAGDHQGLRRSVAMSVGLSAVIAVAMTLLSQLACLPVLRLLNTPENILGNAILYLRIMFGGIAVVTLYNLLAAILRALGDSRTPLYAMLVASVVNIVLDLIFVVPFKWGVAGAAAATVIAQACASLFCLRAVLRIRILKMQREDFAPDRALAGRLVRLGAPLAFQNAIISVGGLVVQYVINGFGFIMVAGFTATNKLYGILELAAISYGYAVATFVGQNLGAGKIDRIRHGMRSGLVMALATSAVIGAAMLLVGRGVLSIFVSGEPDVVGQVLDVAYHYLSLMSVMLPVLYLLHLYRSALQGMGDTVMPMLSGIAELVMRIAAALALPLLMGAEGIYYAEVLAWLGAAVLLAAAYYRRMRDPTDLMGRGMPAPPEG